MEKDCCFTESNQWFRYRAAAIIVEDGCVMFARNEKNRSKNIKINYQRTQRHIMTIEHLK